MSKSVLGKGFEGLIPIGMDVDTIATPSEQVRQLPIEKIHPNPRQPRKQFDERALQELAESIKSHGVIQPIVVTPDDEGFRIVAGERRYRASQIASLKKIPAIVRNHKELEELEIALVENVQRVDLSPLEQAVSIVRLRDQFSLTPKQIAKKLGKAETTISNIIRLLQLPEQAIKALTENEISEGHARAILALKFDVRLQQELLNLIVSQQLSVRDAEEWVKQQKKYNEQKSSSINTDIKKRISELVNRGYRIKVKTGKSGGQIMFSFSDDEELAEILKKL